MVALFNFAQGRLQIWWLIIWFHVSVRVPTRHRWHIQIWVIQGSLLTKVWAEWWATVTLVRVSEPALCLNPTQADSNPKSVRILVLPRVLLDQMSPTLPQPNSLSSRKTSTYAFSGKFPCSSRTTSWTFTYSYTTLLLMLNIYQRFWRIENTPVTYKTHHFWVISPL